MNDVGSNSAMRQRMAMYNNNKLKIGLFGANCSSGRAVTLVPERWTGSWEDCLALAQLADKNGVDFMLPVGRWKGFGGETDFNGDCLEVYTWAAALAAVRQLHDASINVELPDVTPSLDALRSFRAAGERH
mgnify:CR=1 FL=1